MRSVPLLSLLPGPRRVVAPDRVLSLSQIELSSATKILSTSITCYHKLPTGGLVGEGDLGKTLNCI